MKMASMSPHSQLKHPSPNSSDKIVNRRLCKSTFPVCCLLLTLTSTLSPRPSVPCIGYSLKLFPFFTIHSVDILFIANCLRNPLSSLLAAAAHTYMLQYASFLLLIVLILTVFLVSSMRFPGCFSYFHLYVPYFSSHLSYFPVPLLQVELTSTFHYDKEL